MLWYTNKVKPMEQKEKKSIPILYFLIPALMAVIGAFFYLPSWYYSLFKVVMVFDAIIAGMIFSSEKNSFENSTAMFLLGTIIVISFIALLGIISQFFVRGGFPKGLWVFLDIVYAIVKGIQWAIWK